MAEFGRLLTRGSFGEIYEISEKKIAKVLYEDGDTNINVAEVDISRRLRSPNLIPAEVMLSKEQCDYRGYFGLQFPKALGNGYEFVEKNPSYRARKKFCYDIASAVRDLHISGYLHLDITPANTVYFESIDQPRGVLIDYGLSSGTTVISSKVDIELAPVITEEMRFCIDYRPPHMDSAPYNLIDKHDIWALGLTFIFIITGNDLIPPFRGRKDLGLGELGDSTSDYNRAYDILLNPRMIKRTLKYLIRKHVPRKERNSLLEILGHMLTLKSNHRYNIHKVLTDKYFQKYNHPTSLTALQPTIVPLGKMTSSQYGGLLNLADLILLNCGWPPFHIEMFFTAIDVYFRLISIGIYNSPAKTAYSIAAKLFYSCADVEHFNEKNDAEALMDLQGIIRRPYIFAQAQNLDELIIFFKELTDPLDSSLRDRYLELDISSEFKRLNIRQGRPIKEGKATDFLPLIESKGFECLNPDKRIDKLISQPPAVTTWRWACAMTYNAILNVIRTLNVSRSNLNYSDRSELRELEAILDLAG